MVGHRMIGLDSLLFLKIAGASLGSSIAVIFKPNGDSDQKIFERFAIGTVIGTIISPFTMKWMDVEPEFYFWLGCSVLSGLVALLVLQLLFSQSGKEAIETVMKKKI